MSIGIASWGVLGVALLLARALYQLTPFAIEAVASRTLDPLHWAILAAWVVFNAYAEGYVGFHQKFSPRVVQRALDLGRNGTPLRVLLAAPYCIGLFAAPRRTMIAGWVTVAIIAALVIGVRHVPQPWRGIIDAGVVVGLGIGLVSLLARYFAALSGILKTSFIFR
jgi:hypothetical protein